MKININNIKVCKKVLLISSFLFVAAFALPASAATTVSIGNYDVMPGGSVNGTLIMNNATDLFGAIIDISYDPTVVKISNVKQADPIIAVTSNIDNIKGSTRIVMDGPLTGVSGDHVLGNISFIAVGISKSSSSLKITVKQMIDINQNDIQATSINGRFNIIGSVLKYIMITPSTTTLIIGGTRTFIATTKDQNGIPVEGINITWSSSDLAVGTISPLSSITGTDGNASTTFTALALGSTTVRAMNGSIHDNSDVIVKAPISEITGSISGYKINDTNGNGKWNAGEKGISGWNIRLVGLSNHIKIINTEILTDDTGFFEFDGLPSGKYLVMEGNKKEWRHTSSTFKYIHLKDTEKSRNNNFTNTLVKKGK